MSTGLSANLDKEITSGAHGVTGYHCVNPADDSECKAVLTLLHSAYPGHSWWVEIRDGVLIVKNYEISMNYGMITKLPQQYSWSSMAKEIKMQAGELLERANLARGASAGTVAKSLEGAPKNRQ